ncbi:hypothetical protein UFOVP96_54 [uncultured Caudovirales phage]|uniref:Gene product 88 domain-containing protein n=1 Tax=uncultured Caudovirales phage TaxID=2100421 RepID=A0A6J5L2E4_9CAUD|nr:hypothetical protein UFOVP96_54 [uncultured Caudovirales phage]
MATVTSKNKAEFDQKFMEQRGQVKPQTPEPTIKGLQTAFEEAIAYHTSLPRAERIANSRKAREEVGKYASNDKGDPIDLLSKNAKLEKAEKGYKGGEPIKLADGSGVETTGLSLSPAHQEGKFITCPNSKSCAKSCLGKTAGHNFQTGGGNDLEAKLGPRLKHYKKTQAFLKSPEAFAVRLYDEIQAAKTMADLDGNHLGVRLNTLSDIHPRVWKPLMDAHPDVTFYDYTKLDTDPVAPNHHLTYSSTGISQKTGDNGLEKGVTNPHQNWKTMRRRLDKGFNVAMAFSHKKEVPNELHDEETGNRYEVVNGNTHDFRPLDQQAPGKKGVIVGLKNSANNTAEDTAANKSEGFFVHYDPKYKREGDKNTGKLMRDENGNPIVQNRRVTIPVQERQKININNDSNPTSEG